MIVMQESSFTASGTVWMLPGIRRGPVGRVIWGKLAFTDLALVLLKTLRILPK